MDKLLDFLPLKSYSTFSKGAVILFALSGVIITAIANDYDAKTDIACSLPKDIASGKDFVYQKCFSKYDAKYHGRIPFGVIVLFNFAVVLAFSIFYLFWAKPRVEKWERKKESNTENTDPVDKQTGLRLFYCYVAHLLLARFLPLLLFALLIFYPINFPTNFSCPVNLHSRSPKTVQCVNRMAAEKVTLAKTIICIDIIFAVLAIAEVMYILLWKQRNKEFPVVDDMEFCPVYILNQEKGIGKIVRDIRKTRKEKEWFLRKKIILQESKDEGQESKDEGQESKDEGQEKKREEVHIEQDQLEQTVNIFKTAQEEKPRRILIEGEPGSGKTAITKRIVQAWKQKVDEFWQGKLVIRLKCCKFREIEKLDLPTLFLYGQGVKPDTKRKLYQFIELHAEKVVVIFDGINDLVMDENSWRIQESELDDDQEEMPVSSLYIKLIQGDFLSDVTIITTTRRTPTLHHLDEHFDRKLKIVSSHNRGAEA